MYTIVDLRGFVIRNYSVGKDQDGLLDVEKDEIINTAQFGFENFMERFLKPVVEQMPVHKIIFCLEGGNDFRRNMYPAYKEGRNKDQSELKKIEINKCQDLVEEALTKLGFMLAKQEGAEADDLIAYLCKDLEGPKLVHTVDGDLKVLAALKETTVAYHAPKTGIEYVTDDIDGLPPRFLTLQKSIVGDTSDNYKGVPGMGIKAWETLVENYGTDGLTELNHYISRRRFDELKVDAEELNCKLLTKLYDKREQWQESYNLAKLYPGLCNNVIGRKLRKVEWTKNLPDQLFINRLSELMDDKEGGADWLFVLIPEFTLVTRTNYAEALDQLRDLIKEAPVIGWDYETYDPIKSPEMNEAYAGRGDFVDVLGSIVTGCSFAVGKFNNDVFYFSANHADTENLSESQMLAVMQLVFESGVEMVAQNIQFEAVVTRTNYDLQVPYWLDTAMFAKNLWEEEPAGLKSLSKAHMNYDQATYKETLGDKEDMSQISGLHVLNYACDDSTVAAHLLHLFRVYAELEGSRSFIEEYDCPSLELLVDGFIEGCPIDEDRLKELANKDAKDKEQSEKTIRTLLQANCSNKNPDAVEEFFKEIKGFERAKLRDKGLDVEIVKTKLEELKVKLSLNSNYVPVSEVYKEVEFKPTVSQINKVLVALGTDVLIESIAANKITEVLALLDGREEETTEEVSEYLELLVACVGKEMKARAGDNYEAFRSKSAEILKYSVEPITVGTELNFGSPTQMQYLLYVVLGLPVRRYTKVTRGSKRDELGFEGSPSTNEKAVQLAIAEDCTGKDAWKSDVLKAMILYTKCDTRFKLYWKPYPLWKHPKDGNLHPQIRQSATVTHRPTGNSPNLLQVSKKDGGHVRSVFVGGQTTEGEPMVYVSIDFNGQELRILASETKDPVMLDAYIGENPKDLHTVTGCAIGKSYISKLYPAFDLSLILWNKDVINYDFFRNILDNEPVNEQELIKVLKAVRNASKTINFGVAYGAGPLTIALGLLIPVETAKELMEALFSRYERLPEWKEEVWEFARKHGYVQTPYGTRRHCWPDIISRDRGLSGRMERQVANYRIQGCGAEILKIVMTNAAKEGIFKDTGAILHGPIYDEIASRVPVSKVYEYVTRLSNCMAITPPGHQVPMVPEVSIGVHNWGYQKELGAFPSEESINKLLEDANLHV